MNIKKALPVLVYEENYAYGGANEVNPDPATLVSSFVSQGRLTPTCKYTQFQGPDNSSQQVVSVYPGNEVIFASLPNYLYKISYQLRGSAKFWRYTSSVNLAYQVYDRCGNLAQWNSSSCTIAGKVELFSFAFPLVVELSRGGEISLRIEAIPLPDELNPLVEGYHCLDGTRIYQNVFDGTLMHRIIEPQFQRFVANLRKRYFSVSSGPCVGILPAKPPSTASTTQIIGIDTGLSLSNFNAKIGLLYFGRSCAYYFWLNLNGTEQTLFSFSPTFYYLYCSTSGTYRLKHNFDVTFNNLAFHRCNGTVALVFFDYETGSVHYDVIGKALRNSQGVLTGYNFNSENSQFANFFLSSTMSYYFAIVSFVHTISTTGASSGVISAPSAIVNHLPEGYFSFTLE